MNFLKTLIAVIVVIIIIFAAYALTVMYGGAEITDPEFISVAEQIANAIVGVLTKINTWIVIGAVGISMTVIFGLS